MSDTTCINCDYWKPCTLDGHTAIGWCSRWERHTWEHGDCDDEDGDDSRWQLAYCEGL